MAEVLVRGIEQDVVDRLAKKARHSGQSLEDLARTALRREARPSREASPNREARPSREEILADLDRIRAMGPKLKDETKALIRAARDAYDIGH